MAQYSIDELRTLIAPIARQHGVAKVSLFGSYAKASANENSDVDLMIEKGDIRSLFQLCGFRLDVQDALRLPVDVITTESSDHDFLQRISKDAVLLYEQA